MKLIFSVSYRSGVRDNVSDVGNTGEVHNDTLEAEAEACMLGAAELTKVEIPPVVFGCKAAFCHSRKENVHALFSLATADDLANAGNEEVHCRNRLVVVV